jgi:hypothetical protein
MKGVLLVVVLWLWYWLCLEKSIGYYPQAAATWPELS